MSPIHFLCETLIGQDFFLTVCGLSAGHERAGAVSEIDTKSSEENAIQ